MLKVIQEQQNWRCYVEQASQLKVDSIEAVIASIQDFPVTLKNDKRSYVKKGELFGRMIVAKQAIDKNTKVWNRFLSLFYYGEARHSLITLLNFKRLGIASVEPILVLEKKRKGVLMDSWLVYEFKSGTASNKQNTTEILGFLKKLHKNNYRHTDPTYSNFLINDETGMFLIDCKGRRRMGYFTDNVDYYLMGERNVDLTVDEVNELVQVDKTTVGYQLAQFYFGYKSIRQRLKDKLRKN